MIYIQRRDLRTGQKETVDEAEKLKEAKFLLKEYSLSDQSARFYMSQRACNNWKTNTN